MYVQGGLCRSSAVGRADATCIAVCIFMVSYVLAEERSLYVQVENVQVIVSTGCTRATYWSVDMVAVEALQIR